MTRKVLVFAKIKRKQSTFRPHQQLSDSNAGLRQASALLLCRRSALLQVCINADTSEAMEAGEKKSLCVKKKVNEADCLLRVSIDRHGSRSYLCLQNWPRAEKKIAQCRRACLLQ